jgi:hypothetical protein
LFQAVGLADHSILELHFQDFSHLPVRPVVQKYFQID